MEDTDDSSRSTKRRHNVTRLNNEYDLAGIGAELEHRWTATGDERMSLRSLAAYFNRYLLMEAISETGMAPFSARWRTSTRSSPMTI